MANNFQPLLVSTQQLIDVYWPAAKVHVEKFVDSVVPDEETVENIENLIRRGQAFLFVVKDDTVDGPVVDLVMIVELCAYTKFASFNIKVLTGRNLKKHADNFFDYFKGWAYMTGVRALEGFVSPAMERYVSKLGFKRSKSCVHVRLKLTGE